MRIVLNAPDGAYSQIDTDSPKLAGDWFAEWVERNRKELESSYTWAVRISFSPSGPYLPRDWPTRRVVLTADNLQWVVDGFRRMEDQFSV